MSYASFGNDLYTGRRSINFVGQKKKWYGISAVLLLIAAIGLGVRGLNLGLEFTGGSEFRVATSGAAPSDYESRSVAAVREVAGANSTARVSRLGNSTVRVQTEKLEADATRQVTDSLASTFDVQPDQVSSTFIGPSWGASVSQQALRALVVFLLATMVLMALYFRTWKMAVAAIVALAHDMAITVGIYALSGFEVSPASMIGFLTVLGYSLYDTVVVFDKVRENTTNAFASRRMSYPDAANLAVNQTLVRSINTTVVALLPILAVLVIGFTQLGPGTLLDLTLSLFIGMAVGAFSSIFIATPLLVWLRRNEPAVVDLERYVERHASRRPATPEPGETEPTEGEQPVTTGATRTGTRTSRSEATTVTGRAVHKYAQSGPRNQPKRAPKSKR